MAPGLISYMKRINDNLTLEMSNCRNLLKTVCDAQVYFRILQLIHKRNRQLYERLCIVKDDKINHLCANQSIPNTIEPVTVVNGAARVQTNTDKLVVSITGDLHLDEDERSLSARVLI